MVNDANDSNDDQFVNAALFCALRHLQFQKLYIVKSEKYEKHFLSPSF